MREKASLDTQPLLRSNPRYDRESISCHEVDVLGVIKSRYSIVSVG